MKIISILFLGAFLSSFTAFSQKTIHEDSITEKHSVSGNVFGSSSLVGITYE